MTAAAEALILGHLDLVGKVASRVARRLPSFIEMDEIISAGNVGLVEAAIRFDPARHASFAVWAMLRIRGAIIDCYRGRNYPRLTQQLPAQWEYDGDGMRDVHGRVTENRHQCPLPEALIDTAPSIEACLIERQESVRVIEQALQAHGELVSSEREAFSLHLVGASMREIGAANGRSGAWAHYTLHAARHRMRARLGVIEGGRKAA